MWSDPLQGPRRHSLIPKKIGSKIPPFHAVDNEPIDELVPLAKLFAITSDWTWYVLEWDADTGECFGLIQGLEQEMGYFSLDELSRLVVRGTTAPVVERDKFWRPETIGEIKAEWDRRRHPVPG